MTVLESQSFGMEVSAKAFSIITSGIYSNKIESVVREVSTNAVDSHLLAGHEKSYDVRLPTWSEPFFSVRDYGVGLTEEEIINVFTVAFSSTKEGSKLTTGQLGIGAMSPFCYNSQSFNVTSWKNGKMIVYHMYLEDGMPKYTLLGSEDSDEETGVRIDFPVHKNDIDYFTNAAKKVYCWTQIKPNFNYSFETLKFEKDLSLEEGVFTGNYSCRTPFNSSVLMGGVLYPVPLAKEFEEFKTFNNMSVLIEAEIGEVDFQPSREGLQLTKKTVAFIRSKMRYFEEKLAESIGKEINDCDNLLDASRRYIELHRIYPLLRNLNLTYKGKGLFYPLDIKSELYTVERYKISKWKKTPDKIYGSNFSLVDNPPKYIFVNDESRGPKARIVRFLGEEECSYYVVDWNKKEYKDKILQEVSNKFDLPEECFTLVSSLPKLETKEKEKKERISDLTVFNPNNSYRVSLSWQNVENCDEGIKFYLPRFRFDARVVVGFLKKTLTHTDVGILLNFYKYLTGENICLYGVKESEVESLDSEWVNFYDHIQEIIPNGIEGEVGEKFFLERNRMMFILMDENIIGKDHDLIKLNKQYEDLAEFPHYTINSALILLGKNVFDKEVGNFEKLKKKYPELRYISDKNVRNYYVFGIDKKEEETNG